MDSRVHIYVSGRVQGVCFRDFTQRRALSLGLKGWVRNLSDGRVELAAEGAEERLKMLIEKLREGPSYARVEDLELLWESPTGEFENFRIIR